MYIVGQWDSGVTELLERTSETWVNAEKQEA